MFLPIGDDIQKRTLPIIPVALIIANVLVFCGQMQIAAETPISGEAEYEFMMTGVVVMLICRRDTQCEVTEDAEGNLIFEGAEKSAATLDQEIPSAFDIAPPQPVSGQAAPGMCMYCGFVLEERHRIAGNLARCGNPSCGHMVFLETAENGVPVST